MMFNLLYYTSICIIFLIYLLIKSKNKQSDDHTSFRTVKKKNLPYLQ